MIYNIIIGAVKINVENIKTVAWCLIAGMIVALVVSFYYKTVSGALVRRLLENGAVGEENAKTAAEIGLLPDAPQIVRYRKSETMKRVVSTVGNGDDEKFFIAEEHEKRAAEQFGLRGNELLIIIIGTVSLITFGVLLTVIL